jgi:hypothetical protein
MTLRPNSIARELIVDPNTGKRAGSPDHQPGDEAGGGGLRQGDRPLRLDARVDPAPAQLDLAPASRRVRQLIGAGLATT